MSEPQIDADESSGLLSLQTADVIARTALEHFAGLPPAAQPQPERGEWGVIAAIVAEQQVADADSPSFQVLACASGCKCIGAAQRADDGGTLHDSHAEVWFSLPRLTVPP